METNKNLELPEAFCFRMKKLLGEEYAAFCTSLSLPPQRGLRINPLKTSREAFLRNTDLPLRALSFYQDGFYLDAEEQGTGNTPAHHAGMFYLQEPSAMIPVASAPVKAGDYVLDVCAAPGGKSTQLAGIIGEDGLLLSNEYVPSRAKILASNLERLGVRNSIVTNTDAETLADRYPSAFDIVLVDAPCSGEGMFRKSAEAIVDWSPETVAMCAERSFGILCSAAECLRPGGTLIYSTCTYAVEENEGLIARFLTECSDYIVCPLPDQIRSVTAQGIPQVGCVQDLSLCGRCYPHRTGGEGQFVCVMKKAGDSPRKPVRDTLGKPTKQEIAQIEPALSDLFGEKQFRIAKVNGVLSVVPWHLSAAEGCFTAGVRLGELTGGRLQPHHQLFSAYGREMRRKWNFPHGDPRVALYLHGDTVSLTEEENTQGDGFGCFLVDGVPLGGVKNVKGTLKNHYPKGLRRPN